jgi:uncharacterized OB-fold protein
MTAFDLVIRGGSVVDGTGGPARTADVAIRDGFVVKVGRVSGTGHREISADGSVQHQSGVPGDRQPAAQPDADSTPFRVAAREGRLVVQRCDDCATYRFPPRPICDNCRSPKATFQPVSGRGRVVSWVLTHQKFHPAFADRVPYVVLLVESAEQPGLFMYGNLRPEPSPLTAE